MLIVLGEKGREEGRRGGGGREEGPYNFPGSAAHVSHWVNSCVVKRQAGERYTLPGVVQGVMHTHVLEGENDKLVTLVELHLVT